jgi:hypothetical protein
MTALILFLTLGSAARGQVLGVEVSDHPSAWVDIAKVLRPFEKNTGTGRVATDSHGWPTTDGFTVLMDDRPFGAWAPPADDPANYQPDESGDYHLSFKGQAEIVSNRGSSASIHGLAYDVGSNLTTCIVTLPKGAPNLIVLEFGKTRRTPSDAVGTGITDLRCIRPGYPASNPPVFTKTFLNAVKPFAYLRCMGWLDTNFQAGYYGDTGHHMIRWSDRTLPDDASQGMTGLREGSHGVAWEYLILLANATHKDLWINVPISATGAEPNDAESYVHRLAQLLKTGNTFTGGKGLDPSLHIYVEHSNEVWNFGFSQYVWDKLAAIDEVKIGGSVLSRDGSVDQEQWQRRRHAKRLYEIAKIFESVFGSGSLNTRIRPIYSSWAIQPGWYDEVLSWMSANYGPPSQYFYALATTAYFNDHLASHTASPADVLSAMRSDSDAGVGFTTQLRQTANRFGLKLAAYEAGPDNGGGDATNVGNRILANRLPAMRELVLHGFRDNFFGQGGDLATYFALSSSASRYGSWGATEDLSILSTPKYLAIKDLVSEGIHSQLGSQPRLQVSVPPPTNLTLQEEKGTIKLTWKSIEPNATYTVWYTTGGNYIVAGQNLSGLSFTHAVTLGQAYTYYVTATLKGSQSPPSMSVRWP